MRTFGTVLQERRGFGAGFDFVRIALAMGVLLFHSTTVTDYRAIMDGPTWIVPSTIVPMFFGVSGFLITGSAMRLRLRDFLINRALRIFPALAVDILVSAIIIGPIFTVFPLTRYFSDRNFFQYFGNVLGLIQFDLPGVFLTNHLAGVVNLSLWTVPYELLCYGAMSLAMLCGLLHRRRILLLLCMIFLIAPFAARLMGLEPDHLPRFLTLLFFGHGSGAFQCFMAGILLFLYRERIPYDIRLATLCLAAVATIALVGNQSWLWNWGLTLALTPLLAYLILFLGLTPIPPVPLYARGDYSYGVYLYGFPIQQALVSARLHSRSWAFNFLASLILVTIIAVTSWHCIEKPILRLRKRFSFVGRRIAQNDVGQKHDDILPVSEPA